MKLIGIVLLFLSSAGAGWLKSLSLKRRWLQASECVAFVSAYKETVRCRAGTVAETAGELALGGRFLRLEFLKPWYTAMSEGMSPYEAYARIEGKDKLPPDIADTFGHFTVELGHGDRRGEEELCVMYITLFREIENRFAAEYREKGRLYRNLGIYAGAFLAVIMI